MTIHHEIHLARHEVLDRIPYLAADWGPAAFTRVLSLSEETLIVGANVYDSGFSTGLPHGSRLLLDLLEAELRSERVTTLEGSLFAAWDTFVANAGSLQFRDPDFADADLSASIVVMCLKANRVEIVSTGALALVQARTIHDNEIIWRRLQNDSLPWRSIHMNWNVTQLKEKSAAPILFSAAGYAGWRENLRRERWDFRPGDGLILLSEDLNLAPATRLLGEDWRALADESEFPFSFILRVQTAEPSPRFG